MKQKQYCLLGIIAILAFVFILPGCSEEQKSPVEVSSLDSNKGMDLANNTLSCPYCIVQLLAGAGQNDLSKGTNVGQVKVWNDQENLYVRYNLKSGCGLTEAHVWVGTNPNDLPKNSAPGQFPYKIEFDEAQPYYQFPPIPLSDLGDIGCGDKLYIATHAEVCCGCDGECETAWGYSFCYCCPNNYPFEKKWGWYFDYTVSCPPPCP